MATQEELRSMVLDLARAQARKVVETVKTTDLDFGRVHEHVEVGDAKWQITARYWEASDVVRVEGSPTPNRPDGSMEIGEIVFQMFSPGEAEGGGDEMTGSFNFVLPACWLGV